MTHLRRAGVRTSLLIALLIAASGTVSATGNAFAYIHVLGNGTPLSKSEYVASVRATPRAPTRGELTVRVYGDVAVITGDFNNRMRTPGQPERVVEAYATQVIRKVDGKMEVRIVSAFPEAGSARVAAATAAAAAH